MLVDVCLFRDVYPTVDTITEGQTEYGADEGLSMRLGLYVAIIGYAQQGYPGDP
jgi:hypothetical protein